jgi:hypothetical protein
MNGQPILPPAAVPAHLAVCGTCRFSAPGPEGRLVCRQGPPQVVYLPLTTQGSIVAGIKVAPSVQWLIQSFYPPVGKKTPACGQWAPRPELTN